MPGEKESSRNLLEDLEKGWDDSEADLDQVPAEPASAPSLDELDARWGDNLFDEEDEEEEDEPEEPEPELPDEKIDPVAYAAAKKAREERAEARRLKKKQRLDTKKAKRRARLEAIAAQKKKKQKAKKRERPQPTPREMKRERVREAARATNDASTEEEDAVDETDTEDAPVVSAKTQALKSKKLVPAGVGGPPWKLIAIGGVVVLAAAAAFAALWR